MKYGVNSDGYIYASAEDGSEGSISRWTLRRYADAGYALVFVKSLIDGDPNTVVFHPVDEGAIPAAPCPGPPLDDLRAVLDWMHVEIASSSQCDIIAPRDRDRLLALAGRVEAWLVAQGEGS